MTTIKKSAPLSHNILIIALAIITITPFATTILNAQSKEATFTHITSDDGLSLSSVTQIIQDNRGFLWFGTFSGLNRFDGYSFRVFLPENSNPKSISNHSIVQMLEDKKGNIWIGTLDGLNKYDKKKETFKRYYHNKRDDKSLSHDNVLSLFEDKDGTLWVGTLDGLNKYNPESDNFTVSKKVNRKLNPDSLNSVICIHDDHFGNLWLGTWNGLVRMNKKGDFLEQYFDEPYDSKNFDYRKVTSLYHDRSNNLWIGTNKKGLKKFDYQSNKFVEYPVEYKSKKGISNPGVTVIYEDAANNLWVGTRNGLNRYDRKNNSFEQFLNNPDKPLSLISNEIFCLKEDRSGILWIGSSGGVSKYYQSKNQFEYYSENHIDISRRISSNRLSSIWIDKTGLIWLGSFEGVDQINPRTNTIRNIKNIPGNKNSLSDNNTKSVFGDSEGFIWIGTNHSGLNKYDPRTGEFKHYKYDISDDFSLSNDGVISIFEDKNGTLWFGTWWGLNKFDKKTEKFKRYLSNKYSDYDLLHDIIWCIYEDSQGMLWIGTDGGGVSQFNPKTEKFTNYVKEGSKAGSISENRVFSVFESKDGTMWFGTGDGLNRLDRKTGKMFAYNTGNGLSGNLVNGIREDKKGFIWIATDKGLSKLNRKTDTFTNYSKRNGLEELEFTLNVTAESENGYIYFGGKNGLLYFHPDSIKDSYLTAPVVFTDLKIYNQSVEISDEPNSLLPQSIIESTEIKIPYGNDVITIEYALLDFFNVKKNQYMYKLEGFDDDWNNIGARNNVTFTNLSPGEYIFHVRAQNTDGIKNSKEASLKLIIIPAFYQTWLFRILLLSALSGMVILFIKWRTRQVTTQNRILENHVAERTKDLDKNIHELNQEIIERKKAEEKVQASLKEKEVLLKEIHHRVKNNLQVISSLLYLQSITVKDEDTINLFNDSQNRIKSMALIHEKLYQSDNFAFIDFGEYVKSLVDYFNRSFNRKDPLINTSIKIENIFLSLDTAISCGLIVNELMTNTHKYAYPEHWIENNKRENGYLIEIIMEKIDDDNYLLIVRDDGIGISDDVNITETDSLGLKIVASMVDQINGNVEISGKTGTEFKISFSDIKQS